MVHLDASVLRGESPVNGRSSFGRTAPHKVIVDALSAAPLGSGAPGVGKIVLPAAFAHPR